MVNSEKLDALNLLGRWDHVDQTQQQPVSPVKLWALDEGTAHDVCCSLKGLPSEDVIQAMTGSGIRSAPRSRTCTLFRTLYTSACSSDCVYCTNSAQSKSRYSYTPEELVRVFHHLYVENVAQGLFLSSAMGGEADRVMEGMLEAVEVLRTKHGFRGYVHLKVLPGASHYHVQRAVELADRVSLNVEEPSGGRLGEVCTTKDYETDIIKRQTWIKDLSPYPPSGQATQFIVGATDETDREIIARMDQLYRDLEMRRIYYSAFEPIPDTRLESRQATPAWRQHRLYQVDWLHRVYRYPADEIMEALHDDFLPNRDPKISLAHLLLREAVDVNEASRDELLRVPGIGPLSARRIISLRSGGVRIRSRKQLAQIGVVLRRAQPFIDIDGKHQSTLTDWSPS